MTNLSRRAFAFAFSALSLAAGTTAPARVALANQNSVASTPPLPIAQIKLGRFTVTALADGFADMPFSFFTGRTPQQIEAAAAAQFAANPGGIRLVFNQYLIDDGERRILVDTGPAGVVSDMLFHPSLHPVAADIGFVFEQDPAAARAMRAGFFPRAAKEKALIAATHMPFPGLGHIVSDGGQMRWLAAEWAHQGWSLGSPFVSTDMFSRAVGSAGRPLLRRQLCCTNIWSSPPPRL